MGLYMKSYSNAILGQRQKRRKRNRIIRFIKTCIKTCFTLAIVAAICFFSYKYVDMPDQPSSSLPISSEYPKELLELLEKNKEAEEFVLNYSNRDTYMNMDIDLSGELENDKVPLLMQWDKRWGYNSYGKSCIGLAGCGPTCLTMAYLYFTGDTSMNPRTIAKFCENNGYYSSEGTSWLLWTEGVRQLGLNGNVISLDQHIMEKNLNEGSLIVCSMSPGDFTTSGHFILIYDYNENGFYVNDPNRKSTSEKQWSFDTLSSQIKNLWTISY